MTTPIRNEVKSLNTQIIAIANQKGGVGKTTTCANLGIGLAQAGKKVLLIDGDPQGSLTISLGHPQPDKLPFTLSDAMGRILMDEPLRPGEGILHHPEGVDLMPADIQLSGMEVSLVNAMSRETILRQYLDTLKGQYSHILIDCQPSLGMLTVNALAAANRVIIPVQAEYLPAKGLEQLLQTVNKVKRQINPKLQIDGILQLRGVRPFLSDKYDITKHPNYPYTADADPKNAFDIEAFLSTRLKLKPNEVYDVYEVDAEGA